MSRVATLDFCAELENRTIACIEAHLARLAAGHDPMGHLFAIERLARAAKAERWAMRRHTEPDRRCP